MANPISFFVMAVYSGLTILISYLVNRRYDKGNDFSTGNRQFGWITVGVSILATYVSSMSFIGVPGWVYQDGLKSLAIHLNYPFVIFFAIVFFIPVFYRLRVQSIYEYLELRFGVRARLLNAVIFIVVQCISSGIVLYAVALILVKVIPIEIHEAIIALSLFTAAYTYFGGITTVIWTDMLQSLVLLFGCFAILASLSDQLTMVEVSTDFLNRLNVIDLSTSLGSDTSLMAGLIAVSFLHLSVYGSNQLIIQRTLAAKSLAEAQKSMLICGFGSFFIYLLLGIIGLKLFLFYDGAEFTNSNNIILDFVFNHTSPLVIGLVMSALIAAAMSTLDSAYNSMATVATYDIYQRFFCQDAEPSHYETFARFTSLGCSVLIIIPSLLAISNESVLKNVATMMSLFVGIRLGSFLLGLFSRTANEQGILAGSMVSLVSIISIYLVGIAWPWYAPVGTMSFILSGSLVSRFYGVLSAEQAKFAWEQRRLFTKPEPVHYTLLIFGIVALGLCFLLPDLISALLF